MMAAGRAAEKGAPVILLEKTARPGQKILVSGKTRCNLTNSREIYDFIIAFGPNGRFLYSAFNRFFSEDLLAWLKKYGLETKTERGGRIFPASDKAADVVDVFRRYLQENGVRLKSGVRVIAIKVENGRVAGVATEKGDLPAGAVILATGGASWPATGSTGDGYEIAAALGHKVIKLRPALVPLVVKETDLARSMQGISLKNVRLTAYRCTVDDIGATGSWKSIIDTRLGEMMITHFGIGGPVTLQMSLDIVDELEKGPVSVAVDLKPALDREMLALRLQRDFDTLGRRSLKGIVRGLVPLKMVDAVITLSGIHGDKPGHQINSAEKERLGMVLKSLRFSIKGPLPLSSAMVTAGGVDLKEIDPRTMASRLVRGLYFCGEVMDINADTGGYNLQAAFSTGWLAGESAAEYRRENRN